MLQRPSRVGAVSRSQLQLWWVTHPPGAQYVATPSRTLWTETRDLGRDGRDHTRRHETSAIGAAGPVRSTSWHLLVLRPAWIISTREAHQWVARSESIRKLGRTSSPYSLYQPQCSWSPLTMFSSALPDLGELVQGLVNTRMTAEESRTALQLLSRTLQQAHNSWPTLDLIRCHSKLSRSLREADTFGDSDDSLELVKKTADLIKHTYRSLADFIPTKSDPALYTTNSQRYLSHEYLGKFVSDFSLPVKAQPGRKPVVSIALPNGPLLAAVCIAVTSHYTAAPINPAAGAGQFQADVLQAGAGCILTTREDYFKLGLEGGWTNDKEITVLLVDLTDDMRIKITTPTGASAPSTTPAPPNVGDDIALILFTSGTSGKKKVVPITTHSIVAGVAFVIESWALTPEDVCLNMMPLYHV